MRFFFFFFNLVLVLKQPFFLLENCCVERQRCNKMPSATVSFSFDWERNVETACSICGDGVNYM